MAHELPFIAAIDEAIRLEMERDDSVLYFGQNMATTENEPFLDAFGKDRVRVTPISETAEIGIAIGAALSGFRPVVDARSAPSIDPESGNQLPFAGLQVSSPWRLDQTLAARRAGLAITATSAISSVMEARRASTALAPSATLSATCETSEAMGAFRLSTASNCSSLNDD